MRWSIDGHAEDVSAEDLNYTRERFVVRREFQSPWVCQESTFWRRGLWERAGRGPRPDLRMAGDLELWVRFFRHAALSSADALLGGIRRHPDQRSVLFMKEYLREADEVLTEEAGRPTPGEVPERPTSLTINRVHLKQLLAAAGLPSVVIATEQLESDLLTGILRLKRERHQHLEANRLAEKALLESEADRASRLDLINTLGTRLAEVDADRQARLESIERLTKWLEEARTQIQQLESRLQSETPPIEPRGREN